MLTNSKIQTKLTVIFLLFTFLPLITLGVFIYLQGRDDLLRSTERNLYSTVNIITENVDAHSKHYLDQLTLLARMPEILSYAEMITDDSDWQAGQAGLHNVFQQLNQPDQTIETFLFLHPETGEVLASSDRDHLGKFFSKKPYFKLGKEGPTLYKIHYSLALEKAIMALATPAVKEGKLLGVIVGWVDINRFLSSVSNASRIGGAELYLVNRANLHIGSLSSDQDGLKILSGIFTEGATKALSKEKGSGVYPNYNGAMVIGAYTPIISLDLALLAEIPLAEVLKNANRRGVRSLLITLAIAVFLLMITLLLSRQITNPIYRLTKFVTAFGEGRDEGEGEVSIISSSLETNQLAAAFIDMVERRKKSEELYRSLVDNMELGVTLIDGNHQIIMANSAQEKMFDKPAGYFHGKKCFVEFEKRDHICPHCPGVEAMATGQSKEAVTQGIRDDGSSFTVRIRAFPVQDEHGDSQGFIEVVEDITERLESEMSLVKAEAANQAKSVFLANMSHELRTPLTAILGFTEILKCDMTIGQEQRQEIAIISRSGQHLLSLINDILDIAKIEAGRTTLQEKSFDLDAFLRGISEMFYSRTVEKGLSFSMEKDADVPRYIKADDGKLRQVLINLLGNALKFTKTGGVTLRVRSADAGEDILTLQFEVEDTGIVIGTDQLKKIFEPFTQVDFSGDKKTGSGLGLTISRQFVNLMGGSIEVESEINSGSLFRFIVTVGRADASEIDDISSSRRVVGLAPGQPTFRILIVEDMLESRKLLAKLLKTVGFEVQEALDGKQGVEAFNSWHPDLIWMDMRMPVMDGYEATKLIKKTEAGQKTPVIALTAHAFESERQEILNIGCDEFIRKPFKEEELYAAMKKHLGVQFVYEEKEEKEVALSSAPEKALDILLPEALAEIPADIRANLLEAAARLDQDRCLSLIEKIYLINQETANALRMLLENYQFEELGNILGRKE